MSIFSKPKVVQPATPPTAPVAAVADTGTTTTPQGIDSFISSGTSVASPKRKASTVKPALIGGV